MNRARVAQLLRALADELDAEDDAPRSEPPPARKPPTVDDIAKARARQNLQRRGLL